MNPFLVRTGKLWTTRPINLSCFFMYRFHPRVVLANASILLHPGSLRGNNPRFRESAPSRFNDRLMQ